MADDRIDWADVAAVGAVAAVLAVPGTRAPVASLLADLRREWCRDYRHGFVADVEHIASALREAHEAGLRERIDVIDCDACGERHLTERGAAIVAENRALRRELRALSLVMTWLDEENRHVDCYGGEWSVWEDEPMPDGTGQIEGGPAKAAGRTMTALAAALGLGVEDE